MKKRSLFAILLAAVMVVSSLAGCGTTVTVSDGNAEAEETEAAEEAAEEAEEATGEKPVITWYAAGCTADTTEINKIATQMLNDAGINVEFNLVWRGWDTYNQNLTNMIATGETFDIFNQSIAIIDNYALSGGIYEITNDDLTNYLAGAVDEMGQQLFDNCRYNGRLYAVPVAHEFAQEFGIEYNETMAEELGLDVSAVKSVADLDDLFAEIKEKSDIIPIDLPGCNRILMCMADLNYVNNADNLALGMDFTDPELGIFNMYENEKVVAALKKIKEWNDLGYAFTDATADYNSLYQVEGKIFCRLQRTKPGAAEQFSTAFNTFQLQLVNDAYYATFNDFPGGWGNAISATSENPDLAMQVLNFAYTTPAMMDLLTFGIEGTDYTKNEEGYIVLPETGYAAEAYSSANWQMGNHYLCSVTEIQAEHGLADIWDKLKEFNNTATVLESTGFFFDTTAYEAEVTAVENTVAEYYPALKVGEVEDVDAYLAEFNEALHANGIDTLIEAATAQYEEFLAAK